MSQKPNITLQDTTQFLLKKLGAPISELTLLSGGEWSQAYSFIQQDKKYVLRWCNSSETFEKDAFASLFASDAMPVPKIIVEGTEYNKYFAISEFAEGEFIETLTPSELEKTLPSLFNLLDALRTTDLSKSSGYGGWDKNGIGGCKSWKAYLLDVKNDDAKNLTHGWYANLAKSQLGTKIFDQLYAQLSSLVDQCPEARELIHSDLLNFNLLVVNDKISAVIDWQCSLYGDSLYEIAWFTFYAPWYPQFETVQLCKKALSHFESVAASTLNIKSRLLCYQLHIGLGSIAYNSFKNDWKAAEEVAEYTLQISHNNILG